eukprot:gene7787-10522_t
MTKGQAAIRNLFKVSRDSAGNLPSMPGIFPDYPAPIVRNADGGRELAMARWGMPSSSKALFDATKKRAAKLEAKGKQVYFNELLKKEPDKGTTNIRNVTSRHWKPWLGVESRCVVPMSSFSEFNKDAGGDIWFALDESRPLVCFAGLWTNWASVRKVRDITQRVQTLDTLRKLRHAVEQAPNSIFIAGADGNIEYVNPAFTATTGYSPEEVIGRNPRMLSAGATPASVYADLWQHLDS